MADQTMITVKRPDGTIEKISLAEFKARQKKATPAAPPQANVINPIKAPAPFVPASKAIVRERPQSPVKAVPPKQRAKPDMKAIASEIAKEVPKAQISAPMVVKPQEIKKTEQKTPATTEPKKFGKSDAKSLLEEEVQPSATVAKPLVKPMGMPKALMKEIEDGLPATSSPVNSFKHPPQSMRQNMAPGIPEIISEKTVTAPPVRPIVRDIAPAKPSNLGPVDEIEFFTLTDFRRLSSNPTEAAARLKQKFLNLKEESYILFLDGLSAWRQSPLFSESSGAVIESINTKKKLSDIVSADPGRIQMPEIQAIIQMEKELQ